MGLAYLLFALSAIFAFPFYIALWRNASAIALFVVVISPFLGIALIPYRIVRSKRVLKAAAIAAVLFYAIGIFFAPKARGGCGFP